jgi:hypothetical protein
MKFTHLPKSSWSLSIGRQTFESNQPLQLKGATVYRRKVKLHTVPEIAHQNKLVVVLNAPGRIIRFTNLNAKLAISSVLNLDHARITVGLPAAWLNCLCLATYPTDDGWEVAVRSADHRWENDVTTTPRATPTDPAIWLPPHMTIGVDIPSDATVFLDNVGEISVTGGPQQLVVNQTGVIEPIGKGAIVEATIADAKAVKLSSSEHTEMRVTANTDALHLANPERA